MTGPCALHAVAAGASSVHQQEHRGHETGDEEEACGNEEYSESRFLSEHSYSVTLSIDVLLTGRGRGNLRGVVRPVSFRIVLSIVANDSQTFAGFCRAVSGNAAQRRAAHPHCLPPTAYRLPPTAY